MKTKTLLPQKTKVIKKQDNQAIFEIDGCYPGYGMTLGNAFRRVLLSSLPGAAITSVKIKGASHEFSTIPHVLEDVIQIILNLKQIRFKILSQEVLPIKIQLKTSGQKEVKAKDIKATSEVEIVNKEAPIATLTDKKAKLEMEIEIDSGLGYVPVEQRKKEKLEIGAIALDAIFSPIKKVNYEVENMRVGERTDFNRLKINIETDGTILPEQAFAKAADILVEHFELFASEKEKEEKKKSRPKSGSRQRSGKSTKKTTKKK
jgi:DNA-directed RNA polymerase subunit alpha